MLLYPLTLEDCQAAAHLHHSVFYKGWEELAFREFLQDSLVFGLKTEENHQLSGYILWREVKDEAEVLTLVIAPLSQRQGKGSLLLATLFERLMQKGISKLFLEVAEDNVSAQSFYLKHGFIFLNKRPNYYSRKGRKNIAALNFFKKFPLN